MDRSERIFCFQFIEPLQRENTKRIKFEIRLEHSVKLT